MILSAKAYFDDRTVHNTRLLIRAETALPMEFVRRYRKNVIPLTPKKTSALRRSIITRTMANRGEVGWRSEYAQPQNQGYHTITEKRVVNIDGRFVTLHPGVYHYRHYTTPGTGPHFANIAYTKTLSEMPAVLRELGLVK